MAAYQGAVYDAYFTVEDQNGNAVDITGWTFEADIREDPDSATSLLNCTSAGGQFIIIDGPNGRFALHLLAAETLALPEGRLVFDVMRTSASPGPEWLFAAKFIVRQPITR